MYKNGRVQGAYTTLPFCDCTSIARAHWALPSPIARAHGHFPSAKWKNPWARANEMEVPSGRVQLKWKCPVGACIEEWKCPVGASIGQKVPIARAPCSCILLPSPLPFLLLLLVFLTHSLPYVKRNGTVQIYFI